MNKTLASIHANPKNPRKITDEKLEQLKHALAEFGDLSGFIYNRKTKQLVSGHQRLKSLPPTSQIKILREYHPATKKGTVAVGYVLHRGERFAYREVLWSKDKEYAANIAANANAGDWDERALSEMMREIDELGYDLKFTMFSEDELADFLTPSIEPNFTDDKDTKKEKGEKKRVECPSCSHRFIPGWS